MENIYTIILQGGRVYPDMEYKLRVSFPDSRGKWNSSRNTLLGFQPKKRSCCKITQKLVTKLLIVLKKLTT